MPEPTHDERRNTIARLINDIGTGMMVTLAQDDDTPGRPSLHARPMHTAEVGEAWTTLWFATRRDSRKVAELRHDDRICLTYSNSTGSEWVSVAGTAAVRDDRARIKELWRDMWQAWFDGPDDPNLVLIEVDPEGGEYWESDNRLIVWTKLAAAAVTGSKVSVGEQHKVKL